MSGEKSNKPEEEEPDEEEQSIPNPNEAEPSAVNIGNPDGYKIAGETSKLDGTAVFGHNTSTGGDINSDKVTVGVTGKASGSARVGVAGINVDSLDTIAADIYCIGVHGAASPDSGIPGVGVLAEGKNPNPDSNGENSAGVYATGDGAGIVCGHVGSSYGDALLCNDRLTVRVDNSGDNFDPTTHAAHIENETDGTGVGLAITMPNQTAEPDNTTNFVTFRSGGSTTGSIEGNDSGGVTLDTDGADYAEYLPIKAGIDSFEPGDVVGVEGGKLTYRTGSAQRIMVVTEAPAVAGNSPGQNPENRNGYEKVAFVGQVETKVAGQVEVGDMIVPSGNDDGIGTAISLSEWNGESQVIGRAWERDTNNDVSKVIVAVGIDDPSIVGRLITEWESKIKDLEAKTGTLREENEQLRERNADLEARLDAVEDHLGIGTAGDQGLAADD